MYSLVIWSRSFTRLFRLSSFNWPPLLVTVVKPGNQLADPRAVDVVDLAEVQQNLLLVLADHVAQSVAQGARSFAQRDPTRHVDYADIPHLPSVQLYAHEYASWLNAAESTLTPCT